MVNRCIITLAPAAAIVIAAGAVAVAASRQDATVSNETFANKRDYCLTCHGLSGEGFRGPALPMPRLAGQQPEYTEDQLKAFAEGRRAGPVMGAIARVLSPAMIKALSASFHHLDPPPLGGAPKELASEGETIYEKGVPGANIPPCAECHGPKAKGDGKVPRLAGQLNDYNFKTLSNWSHDRGQKPAAPGKSAIMQRTAQSLNPHQIAAVSAYLSQLQ